MNCRHARNLVQARHDTSLPPRQESELQAHLDVCPSCTRLARSEALCSRWLQELPASEPTANFEWRLKLRLAALDRPLPLPAPGRGPAPWLWPFVVSTAAAAVLVLTVGLVWNGRRAATAPTMVAAETSDSPALRPWAPNPADTGARLGWPRLVPVRAGAPLGPEVPGSVTASILGSTGADTARARPRSEPIDTHPVSYFR